MSDKISEFNKFHSSNPHIYRDFCYIAKRNIKRWERVKTGPPRLSAYDIIDEIRRDPKVKTTTMRRGQHKVNRDHVAFYARLFMSDYPEHTGLFRIKAGKHVSKAQVLFDSPQPSPRKSADDDYDHY